MLMIQHTLLAALVGLAGAENAALRPPTNLPAQAHLELGAAFDAAMQRSAPEYQLQATPPARGSEWIYKRWVSGSSTVSARYLELDSVAAVTKKLRAAVSVISIPSKNIDGVGDEAYIVAPYSPSGERHIWFRQGVVVVGVTAPWEDGVRRFAALFAEEIARDLAGRGGGDRGR
jgi:hypothetical protein